MAGGFIAIPVEFENMMGVVVLALLALLDRDVGKPLNESVLFRLIVLGREDGVGEGVFRLTLLDRGEGIFGKQLSTLLCL